MSITVGVKKFTVSTKMLPFLRKSRFRNLGNFCWWNPESLKRLYPERIRIPVSGIRIPRRGIQTPRLSCISFQGVTKAFDFVLCNNCILTLLNVSFYCSVSHIFVRYESLKVKFAAKSQSRLQLSLRRSKSNFRQDCRHFKRFWHVEIFLWRFFCFVCGALCVEMKAV